MIDFLKEQSSRNKNEHKLIAVLIIFFCHLINLRSATYFKTLALKSREGPYYFVFLSIHSRTIGQKSGPFTTKDFLTMKEREKMLEEK
jgi:hypothetical protein